jgi:hypothetical protein
MPTAQRIKASATITADFPHIKGEMTFRTPCISAILGYFGITKKQFKFAQFLGDMQRIFRRDGWRMSKVNVPENSNWIYVAEMLSKGLYVMSIDSHVFLVKVDDKHEMNVQVDTDSMRKFKFPEVDGVYKINRIK